ncbi:MAG: DUF1127 domain-containing protein [Pseudomonadota bacterium]
MIRAIKENALDFLLNRFWNVIDANAQAISRRREIEVLQSKSDAELARLGVNREKIAQHVFQDLYYV